MIIDDGKPFLVGVDYDIGEIAPETWWYLSFVDTDKSDPPELQVPGGGGFQGVCVVRGTNIMDAAQQAWKLGCNPGGQVAGIPLDSDRVPLKWTNRLLTAAEIDRWEAEETDA